MTRSAVRGGSGAFHSSVYHPARKVFDEIPERRQVVTRKIVLSLGLLENFVKTVPPYDAGFLVDFKWKMAAAHHGGSVEFAVHGGAAENLNVEGGAAPACGLEVPGEHGAQSGVSEFVVEIREHAEYTGFAHGGVDGRAEGRYAGEVYAGYVYGFGPGHDARIGR